MIQPTANISIIFYAGFLLTQNRSGVYALFAYFISDVPQFSLCEFSSSLELVENILPFRPFYDFVFVFFSSIRYVRTTSSNKNSVSNWKFMRKNDSFNLVSLAFCTRLICIVVESAQHRLKSNKLARCCAKKIHRTKRVASNSGSRDENQYITDFLRFY